MWEDEYKSIRLFFEDKDVCNFFITCLNSKKRIKEFLIECPNNDKRLAIISLIILAYKKVSI